MVLPLPAAFYIAGLLGLAMSAAIRMFLKHDLSRGLGLWCGGGLLLGASLLLCGASLSLPYEGLQPGVLALGGAGLLVQLMAVRYELNRPMKVMQGVVAWMLLVMIAPTYPTVFQNGVFCFIALLASVAGHVGFLVLKMTKLNRRIVQLTMQLANQEQAIHLSEQLAQLDRRHGMAGVAASLAHELSQPLTNLYLITDRLDMELKEADNDLLRQCVQDLQRNTHQAGDMLRKIRAWVQSRDSRFERVALGRVVEGAVRLSREWGFCQGVQIDVLQPSHSLFVRADPIQLTHIFVNVLRNAMEATAGQSVRLIGIRLWREGQTVHASFQDNGPGMTTDVLRQVGTVFFTPQSMGVGLTISRSMAKHHGGKLLMSNLPAGGACVELQLPALE